MIDVSTRMLTVRTYRYVGSGEEQAMFSGAGKPYLKTSCQGDPGPLTLRPDRCTILPHCDQGCRPGPAFSACH